MKRCLFFLFYCGVFMALDLNAIEFTKKINYLEEIEFQGVGKMILKQGDRCEIKVQGDDAIAYDTQVTIHRGLLKVHRKESAFKKPSENLTCLVTIENDLNKVVLLGDAELKTEALVLQDVQIDVHDRAQAAVSITGDDFLGRVYDKGKLHVEGRVKSQIVLVEDLGNYEASQLQSRECEVKIVGGGKAVVQSENSLSAFVVGDGTVVYVKEPKKLNKRVSGKGQITQGNQ
jgi:hypothetical protein